MKIKIGQSSCKQLHFDALIGVFVLSLVATPALLCSCTSPKPSSGQGENLLVEKPVAYPQGMDAALKNKISQIHVGMTFKVVAQIMPIYVTGFENVEHGGTWFDSPAGTNWIVTLRFENASKQPDLLKRRLNWRPEIRARIPDDAPW